MCGETMFPVVGLVGDLKLGGNEGGELLHCSMCSGLIEVGLVGLGGRGLPAESPPAFPPCCVETEGEVVAERGVGVLSLGVVTSVALDCGLLAVLLPPGELAVAVLPSEVPPWPFSLAAAAFSAFLHLARLF